LDHEGVPAGRQTAIYIRAICCGRRKHFKQLPPDWKFRTKILDKDLIEVPQNSVAAIMPYEFFNVYDAELPR
jgi:hypothetical protein